ncbi:AMP-dependent synthetase and ligase [Streptomyces davaonensis JCM 4913]|uniref:AMP-dependent synthetase and ligase n=1 Tax=Streptomyces davaonensis (strain DSM 101723 / JCM 4913 / KCC S-0913 / 768) TaxID=1214101 RepID=K4QST7_STRDJ|nr:AMP-binding protein [Streptomyces davaonensis]CCK25221.1 AMP-dependent synthetase and ligase [Streptomyces davaonensis JCM 4913]
MLTPSDLLSSVPGSASPLFATRLAAHGDRPALLTRDGELSYRRLAEMVTLMAARLGTRRRLVLLAATHTTDVLVTYLAALAAGHPVLLVPGDNAEAVRSLTAAYDPDIVVSTDTSGELCLDERRAVSAHELHPDLALLLSTSGSTGSPKLVRLSYANLQANAESIADYLGIREDDRAATTLPLHYCYGLSVVNSHLLRGAGLVLTDLSVADDGFWDLFRAARATTFAAVPYTFDLLDRIGFADLSLPHLRYITQAGGRLAPDRVAHYAELGRREGWDLYVMYGQTEATARMAYLPPDLAATRPEAIGVPIPGGSFHLEPHPDWPDEDTGELVYSGPNVMLGYAEHPADLALGRTTQALHTGDIARRAPDGLYEIVGRSSRFAKILGLRIDPERVESLLRRHGHSALCAGGDDVLRVAVAAPADADTVRRTVTAEYGLPPRAVAVHVLPELPRLATGKPDYEAVRKLGADATPSPGQPTDLRQLYARILDRPDVTEDDSFVSLGGDSLSYVEMSLNLEQTLGDLPPDWHTTPIRDLRRPKPPAPSRRRTLETGIALRAAAIVLIAGSHIHVIYVKGGAHLLLALAGYNLARFHLTPSAERRERVRHGLRSIARIVVPSLAWIALVLPLTDDYGLSNLFLLHSVLGPHDSDTAMHFWFIEALTYILVGAVALLGLRAVDRAERRFPFALPMSIAALGLVTRYDLLGLQDRGHVPSAVVIFWLFALGWAAAKADSTWQRVLVTVVALATIPGFFPGEPFRDAVVAAGFVLLVWVRRLPSRAWINSVAGVLASSSLYIYLTHWQIYPLIDDFSGWLALFASLLFGIGYAAVANRGMRWAAGVRKRRSGVSCVRT